MDGREFARHWHWRYGFAFAAWLAATAICVFVPAPYGSNSIIPLLVAAVALSSWLGGRGPGIFVTVLSVVTIDYFFIAPNYAFTVLAAAGTVRLLVFGLTAILISTLNARRLRAENRNRVSAAEMEIARRIQRKLLPATGPEISGFDIAGKSLAANATSGDFYDYFLLKDGSLAIVVADVTGHGFGPALLMAETRAFFRTLALTHNDVGVMLQYANRLVCDSTDDEHFITVFLARLDVANRSFRYAAAGHEGYVLETAGRFKKLSSTTYPLGVEDGDIEFPSIGMTMEPGQLYLLITDGVYEACSPNGELFGFERVFETVRKSAHFSSMRIIDDLFYQISSFTQNTPQRDDMTAVVLKMSA